MNETKIDFPNLLQKLNQLDQQVISLSCNHAKDTDRDFFNIWKSEQVEHFMFSPALLSKLREVAQRANISFAQPHSSDRKWLRSIVDETIAIHRPPSDNPVLFMNLEMRKPKHLLGKAFQLDFSKLSFDLDTKPSE